MGWNKKKYEASIKMYIELYKNVYKKDGILPHLHQACIDEFDENIANDEFENCKAMNFANGIFNRDHKESIDLERMKKYGSHFQKLPFTTGMHPFQIPVKFIDDNGTYIVQIGRKGYEIEGAKAEEMDVVFDNFEIGIITDEEFTAMVKKILFVDGEFDDDDEYRI